jgi:membrane protease YdiL (CAAX protease family)
MTSEFGSDDEILPVEPVDEFIQPDTALEHPPRVWTVFVAFPIVLVGMFAAQIGAVVFGVIWYAAQGGDVQKLGNVLPAKLSQPIPFMMLAGLAQLVVGFGALIPAWLSPEPARFRLGLVKPLLLAWGYPLLALGTIFPFAVGLVPAYFVAKLMGGPNEAVANLYQNMTWQLAVPFILFIAIVPGITEELFFRGYMQRRLLQRWPAWVAILVTSILFAIMHLDPRQITYVFPIGLWLGVVAWRTGSVWPGMLCHAFLNGAWNIFQISNLLKALPDNVATTVAVIGAGLGFVCFCGSIWVMRRACQRPALLSPPPSKDSFLPESDELDH